jgi:hypothetical protein
MRSGLLRIQLYLCPEGAGRWVSRMLGYVRLDLVRYAQWTTARPTVTQSLVRG